MADSDNAPSASAPAETPEVELRRRLAEHPEDVDTLAALGVKCAGSDRLEEARDLLARAIGLRGDEPRLRLMAAGMAANDGDLETAEKEYREALLLRSDLPDAQVGLGQIAELRGQASLAASHFEQARKLAPDHAGAMLGLARLHLDAGRAEQALQLCAQVVQLYPRHAQGLAAYGRALVQRGTPEQAARPLTRALEIEPDLHAARLMLAHVDLDRGDIPAAEKAYRDVLKALPSNADALAGLGDALRAQGRMDEAFLAYDAARRTQPDAEVLTTLRDTCLAAIGREQEALADLRAWIDAHPRSHAPRLLLADILRNRGLSAEVHAFWADALAADPADALAATELAAWHEQRGGFAEAASVAVGSAADHRPLAILLRARVALRAGDHEAALRELLELKSVPLAPAQRHDRLRLLGLAHDRAGRWAEAALAFREAHRIDAGPLPPLVPRETLEPTLAPLLDGATLTDARVAPPVLLLGLPGTWVEHVAALLADQPGIAVRDDRWRGQTDFLADGNDSSLLVPLPQGRLAVQARRYARAQERIEGLAGAHHVVDWIPLFDARLLPVTKLALPGVRAIIVDVNPELAFLRWLAFGWQRALRIEDSAAAAQWFRRAAEQLELAARHLPVVRVDGDRLLADPGANGAEVAAFLGLDALRPGPLLATRLQAGAGLLDGMPPGHQAHYRDALGSAFAALR